MNPEAMNVVLNMQNIIIKQQETIDTLLARLNQQTTVQPVPIEQPVVENVIPPLPTYNVKEEELQENDPEKDDTTIPGIIKKNGFKPSHPKKETDEQKPQEKIEKNASRAKHLWINYGRKIIEYAINHTQGEAQVKIRNLVGKLASKKDYLEIFGIKASDTNDVKDFKVALGRIALFFLKFKADSSFDGSRYKSEMLSQKHIVIELIQGLLGVK
jgi:hypothetical protein